MLVPHTGLVSVISGVAVGVASGSGEVMVLGVAGAVAAGQEVGKTRDVIKEDWLSAFGVRDKSKPLAHMYAAAAGGYEDDVISSSMLVGGGGGGAAAAAAAAADTSGGGGGGGSARSKAAGPGSLDADAELPVILPVHSFEAHDAFRPYFFKNLAVFCHNAGATRVPDETLRFDFKHGATRLEPEAGRTPP